MYPLVIAKRSLKIELEDFCTAFEAVFHNSEIKRYTASRARNSLNV